MHDSEPHDDAGVVLRCPLERPEVHWYENELVRELNWPLAQVQDSVAELARAALAHRRDGFVFPTRADKLLA
jgi:hypothetical protein